MSETVAIGDGWVEIVDAAEDDEQRRVQLRIRATIVLAKEGGRWAISAVRLMVPVEE